MSSLMLTSARRNHLAVKHKYSILAPLSKSSSIGMDACGCLASHARLHCSSRTADFSASEPVTVEHYVIVWCQCRGQQKCSPKSLAQHIGIVAGGQRAARRLVQVLRHQAEHAAHDVQVARVSGLHAPQTSNGLESEVNTSPVPYLCAPL